MTDNTDCNNVISSSEKKGLLETLGKDIEIIKKRLCVITQEKESFKQVKDILGLMNSDEDGLGGNEKEVGSNVTEASVSKEVLVADENVPNDEEGQESDSYTDECVIVPIDPKKSTDGKHNHHKSTSDTPGQNTHVYCEYCNKYITSKGYKNHLYTQTHLTNVSLREKEE
ncbi:unnamed protein product [Rhizophagus irregularis]|nr:unnamed protein product [Rhizophagus irregularis]